MSLPQTKPASSVPHAKAVGIIGVGNMGGGIATNLINKDDSSLFKFLEN
jgi:hypothetical protein